MPNNISIKCNKIFKPIHKSKHRYVVMKGSAGSGKSVDTAQQYILRLISEPGRNLLCVRKVEQSNRNSTFSELVGAVNRMGLEKYFSYTVSPMGIKCLVNKNEVLFAGFNDDRQREKIKSVTFTTGKLTDVWLEEATELQQADVDVIDDRLRGELPRGLFYQMKLTFNPVSSAHWIKRVFFDSVSDDVLTHHSTYLDNKFIDIAYYDRMERRRELDPEGYRIYGLGEWGETSGLIFSNWNVIECEQDYNFYDDVAYGQDFGFNHANAVLCLGIKDGQIYILKELYVTEKDTSEIIPMLKDWDKTKVMFADSAEPDRIQMWRRAGFRVVPSKKGTGSVKAQIDWLKQRKIYIDSSCANTISEIGQYRWQKDRITDKYTDEPININDDAMAALRYGIQNWRMVEKVEAKKVDERTELQKYKDKVLKKGNIRRSYY